MANNASGWAKAVFGHDFAREALLTEALTHGASGRKPTYERLEFLGDRVLGLAVAEMLHIAYPDADEGELGRRHAALVQGATLAVVAREWDVQLHIMTAGGPPSDSVQADVVEALLGALYLDAGWEAVKAVVVKYWHTRLVTMDGRDGKTMLQEKLQAAKLALPVYDVVGENGPDHAKIFTVRVTTALGIAEGQGASKTEASKHAAEALLAKLENEA